MRRKYISYYEGDVFTVPLKNGGYCLGVVARRARSAVTLGYFFGPRRSAPPTEEDIAKLNPEDVTLIKRFGALGIRTGEWQIVGKIPQWKREQWPLPKFVGPGPKGTCTLVTYDEKTLAEWVAYETVPASESIHYFFDSLAGYRAVVIELQRMLDGEYN